MYLSNGVLANLLLCQMLFPFLRCRNQVRIHLQQYSHDFSEEARELWTKIHSLSSGLDCSLAKKKCESRKEIHYFSLTMLVNTAVTYLCCTSIKSFTGWQSSNFFKLIQESMQNNYQFSVKTRMIFFDGLCYVYFSSLCVIYCFFVFVFNQISRHLYFHM